MLKIVKVKTKQDHKWDLTVNGTSVGFAEAVYKTATQRSWFGELHLPTADGDMVHYDVNGLRSVKAVIDHFVAEVGDTEVEVKATVKVKPKKSKYPAVLTLAQVTSKNSIELSKHYGYKYTDKSGKERTGADQAKHLRAMLNAKAKKVAKVPMADLVDIAKGTETQVSSLSEHYEDQ